MRSILVILALVLSTPAAMAANSAPPPATIAPALPLAEWQKIYSGLDLSEAPHVQVRILERELNAAVTQSALKQRSDSAWNNTSLKQRSDSASNNPSLKQRSDSASNNPSLKQRSDSASDNTSLAPARPRGKGAKR